MGSILHKYCIPTVFDIEYTINLFAIVFSLKAKEYLKINLNKGWKEKMG